MKKALVLGATGGMGYAIVRQLIGRGIPTVAFARNLNKLQELYGENELVTVYAGDALRQTDIARAAKGADILFHTVNVPYQQWPHKLETIMRNTLTVAKEQGMKVAVVDNIYAYGRSNGQKVTEATPKKPHTKKGRIRLQVERLVDQAREKGLPVLIAHFPDFYGPKAESTLLHHTFKALVQQKRPNFIGALEVAREYIYTPDGAKALVTLASTTVAYGQNWNIPGSGVITGRNIMDIAANATGNRKKARTVGRGMLALIGLFNPLMREMVEMMYLTEEPVMLSGEKYEREIGPLPQTSYEEGIRETIRQIANLHQPSVNI